MWMPPSPKSGLSIGISVSAGSTHVISTKTDSTLLGNSVDWHAFAQCIAVRIINIRRLLYVYESMNQSWNYFINLYLTLAATLTILTVTLLTVNLMTLSVNLAVAKKINKNCNLYFSTFWCRAWYDQARLSKNWTIG